MNYKVLEYRCGCKYVLICDKNILIKKGAGAIHDHSKTCPDHFKWQKTMTVWCLDCFKKMVIKSKAGYNKKRCVKCAAENTRKRVREAWRAGTYDGRYNYSQPTRKTDISEIMEYGETKKQAIDRITTKITNECQHLLPVLETPILDKMMGKR